MLLRDLSYETRDSQHFLRDGNQSRRVAYEGSQHRHVHPPSDLLACNRNKNSVHLNLIGHRRQPRPSDRPISCPRSENNFTHRLCDKKRDSASLPIRLFFRPSNIADAAISIFELPPPPPPPPPKRTQDTRGAKRSANSIDLLADFPGDLPTPETVARVPSLARARPLYLPMATHSTCPLPIRWQLVDTSRFMVRSPVAVSLRRSSYSGLSSGRPKYKLSSAVSYLATKKRNFTTTTVQRRKVQLRELGSLRWIDSMFSLTQVIHLSCALDGHALSIPTRVGIE